MPFAGNRDYSSVDVNDQSMYAYYWSSTKPHDFYMGSTSILAQDSMDIAYGETVRCFKNTTSSNILTINANG